MDQLMVVMREAGVRLHAAQWKEMDANTSTSSKCLKCSRASTVRDWREQITVISRAAGSPLYYCCYYYYQKPKTNAKTKIGRALYKQKRTKQT